MRHRRARRAWLPRDRGGARRGSSPFSRCHGRTGRVRGTRSHPGSHRRGNERGRRGRPTRHGHGAGRRAADSRTAADGRPAGLRRRPMRPRHGRRATRRGRRRRSYGRSGRQLGRGRRGRRAGPGGWRRRRGARSRRVDGRRRGSGDVAGSGNRGWRRRRRRRIGRRCRRHARGQESERIEVSLLVGGEPDAEVDVGPRHLGIPARADRADGIALGDHRALRDEHGAEVRECDRVAVGREDGDALAGGGDGPCERDRTALRRYDGRARVAGDVDAAVLACGVRMAGIERERLHDVARSGPRPRAGTGDEEQCGEHHRREHASHRHLPKSDFVVRLENVPTTVGAAGSGRQAS